MVKQTIIIHWAIDHNTIMIVMYALEALCNMAKAMTGTNNLWIRINREGYI